MVNMLQPPPPDGSAARALASALASALHRGSATVQIPMSAAAAAHAQWLAGAAARLQQDLPCCPTAQCILRMHSQQPGKRKLARLLQVHHAMLQDINRGAQSRRPARPPQERLGKYIVVSSFYRLLRTDLNTKVCMDD